MIKSIPLKVLLSVELKNVMEAITKQKLPALAYFKFIKFVELMQVKTTEIHKVCKKLQEQSPDLDPLQDEEFKLQLEEVVEVESLPEVVFEKVELTFEESKLVQMVLS